MGLGAEPLVESRGEPPDGESAGLRPLKLMTFNY